MKTNLTIIRRMTEPERMILALNIDKLEISDRDKEIVRYRYGISKIDKPHTLQKTGEVFGLTRERVRQIIKKALPKVPVGRDKLK